MKRYKSFLITVIFVLLLFCHSNPIKAFEPVTAQEAYNMVNDENIEASLIDVRTPEEYAFVGNPAYEDGRPMAYLIPWEFLDGFDQETGEVLYKMNNEFDQLIEQTFKDKGQPLIVICRSGNRSTDAAVRLEQLGYINVFEVDNALKEEKNGHGGRGGVQGSTYGELYYGNRRHKIKGYRGCPERLPANLITDSDGEETYKTINVQKDTQYLLENGDEDDSVSWADLGLPLTHAIDPAKYPHLEKKESGEHNDSPLNNMYRLTDLPYSVNHSYQSSTGNLFSTIYSYSPSISNSLSWTRGSTPLSQTPANSINTNSSNFNLLFPELSTSQDYVPTAPPSSSSSCLKKVSVGSS